MNTLQNRRIGLGTMARWAALSSLILITGLATGCATTRSAITSVRTASGEMDPFEPVNRVIYTVNDKVDRAVFKPLAQGYEYVLPVQVRSCVSNVFGNVADVPASLNNFLQGKFKEGGSDICRVGVNTTVGVLGCFDIATKWGFEKHNEDFGQTLGRWGVASGPYIVLPLFGPSTVRDGAALLVDSYTDPMRYINDVPVRNSTYGLRLIDKRAQALDTTNFIDNAALDPYVFVRDAYLSRRRSLVLDGVSPPPTDTQGGDATQPTSGGPTPK
ncbi:MAG: VacJ family lipoprotein [Burkholderiaceae bacterium]